MSISRRNTYIWLNSLGISSKAMTNIEKEIDKIQNIWDLSSNEINKLKSIRKPMKDRIVANKNDKCFNEVLTKIDKDSVNVITIDDEDYPARLKDIYDAPKVLYYRGKNILSEPSIAIVGSRKMTNYGQWATEKLTKELSDLGVTIISGLALGIDSIAHRTSLDNKGKTIGVIGNGLDRIYPSRNKDLYRDIPVNGAIVSEYFFGTPPLPYNFPHRNRIISGLSLGVTIIEAQIKSGSLITGHHAVEQGKEVFALPGQINSIFSEGTNLLIQDGAKLVLNTEDIIEEIRELRYLNNDKKIDKEIEADLSDLELSILETIKDKPIHLDEIVIRTKESISTVSSVLTILEIKGLVKEMSGRIFTIS